MESDKTDQTAIAVENELQPEDTEQQREHEDFPRIEEKKVFTQDTHTRNLHNLTVDHLNKIVSIHGYRKTINRKSAEEAVGAITDLMHPARSTLKGSPPSAASGKVAVTLTEAVKDLKQLNWQECSVTSIRRISPKNYSTPDDDIPLEEVAEKLMSLKGIKRRKLSTAVEEATVTETVKEEEEAGEDGEKEDEDGGYEEEDEEEYGGDDEEEDDEEDEEEDDEEEGNIVEVIVYPDPHGTVGQTVGDLDLSVCTGWQDLSGMLHTIYENLGGLQAAVLTVEGCWPGATVVLYNKDHHEIDVVNVLFEQVRDLISQICVYVIQ